MPIARAPAMSVYLDHAASTPLRPEAREAWLHAAEVVGNPSSIHGAGQAARRLLEDARERIAAAVDCDPVEVVFTSGGTEAVNLGITGLWRARRRDRTAVVVPAGEHHATLDTVGRLAADGAVVREVGLDRAGRVELAEWRGRLADGRAALATALAANNEVGTLQPVADLARQAAEAEVPLHVDAVAAFGHVPLSFRRLRAAPAAAGTGLVALSLSAHKLGGPAGAGALIVARDAVIEPILHGGGQQRGLRSGTQDAAGAAAFAVAAELAVADLDAETARLTRLRETAVRGIRSVWPDAELLGDPRERLPGHVHVLFPGVSGEALLFLLDRDGVAVSTGSACQAGVAEPSHVVRAIGRSDADARSVLRITLGRTTSDADVTALLHALAAARRRLAPATVAAART